MGVKISDIATQNSTPTNNDRFEISRKISSAPDVWDTRYISWSTLVDLLDAITTLQEATDNGATTTNTITCLVANDGNGLFITGAGDSLNKIAFNNNSDDSGQILVYDETETATINLNGYTGDVSSDSVTTSQVIISAETASTIASFDGSKKIKSLSTSTYPSLSELAYVKGVTSGIQSQIDSKIFVLKMFTVSGFAPVDATTYYFGGVQTTPVTTAASKQYKLPYACTLVAWSISATNNTTNGTTESSTIALRVNNTTDLTLSSSISFGGTVPVTNQYVGTGLSTAYSANDLIEVKWTTPTWATNPTAIAISVDLYFRI